MFVGDGIICDLCGLSQRMEFTYYSFDFNNVKVYQNRPLKSQDITLSLDVCIQCFEDAKQQILKNYKPTRAGIICDLTGKLMKGTFEFYCCEVTKADVKIHPFKCKKCKQILPDELAINLAPEHNIECPSCKEKVEFVRDSDVITDKRHLDINVCNAEFNRMKQRQMEIGQRSKKDKWTTES